MGCDRVALEGNIGLDETGMGIKSAATSRIGRIIETNRFALPTESHLVRPDELSAGPSAKSISLLFHDSSRELQGTHL